MFEKIDMNLVDYILKNGKDKSWAELEEMFKIKPYPNDRKGKKANDIWRRFKRLNPELSKVKETRNKNGDVIYTQHKAIPKTKKIDKSNFKIKSITTNPYGGQWVKYDTNDTIIDYEAIFKDVIKDLKNEFKYKEVTIKEGDENNLIGVVNMYDMHLDKVVYGNIHTNIKEAYALHTRIRESIKDFNLEYIVLPIGNDLFHTNGLDNLTKKGTQLDYYVDPELAYKNIASLVTTMIQEYSDILPVKVVMVRGNHDNDKIAILGYWLKTFFEATRNNVEVIDNDDQRKYITFGKNLIGFAHGDKEKNKIAQLPLIMAQERPKEWGETKYRKFYLGDLHHGFEYQFLRAKDYPGVEVEYLRAVSNTDKWHKDNGYIGVPRTAYVQIFHREGGEKARLKYNLEW